MMSFIKTIENNLSAPSRTGNGSHFLEEHFLWERQEHLAALSAGCPPLQSSASLPHFWTRRTPEASWALATLLISGYDLFRLWNRPLFSPAVKAFLASCDGPPLPLPPSPIQRPVCLWTAYQNQPPETRRGLKAAAYELTAARFRAVKKVDLDPPLRVDAPALRQALAPFTAPDTAQLIVEFAVSPYLPNHLRCCSSTSTGRRCPNPRFERYCAIPVGCCAGEKIKPDACLYDLCKFHLLRINRKSPCVLVSCD